MSLLFDCHCHLESPLFADNLEDVLERASGNLLGVVCSGVQFDDFAKVLSMHEQQPDFVHASLGLHPEYVVSLTDEDIDKAIDQIRQDQEKIVSLGEVGLDYHWCADVKKRRRQAEVFARLISFAKQIDKPLVVHIRTGKDKENNAYEDAFKILEENGAQNVLLHMFGYKKLLNRALENGWYISANAIIESSKQYKKIVRSVPLDRLLLETDSPYLVPSVLKERGTKRNEPLFIEQTAKKVAQIREISFEEVCAQTTRNARKFFGV